MDFIRYSRWGGPDYSHEGTERRNYAWYTVVLEHSRLAQLSRLEFHEHLDYEQPHTLVDSSRHFVSLETEELVETETDDDLMSPISSSNIHTLIIWHISAPLGDVPIFSCLTLPSFKPVHYESQTHRAQTWLAQLRSFQDFPFAVFCSLISSSRFQCCSTSASMTALFYQKSPLTNRFIQSLQVNLPNCLRGQTDYVLPRWRVNLRRHIRRGHGWLSVDSWEALLG